MATDLSELAPSGMPAGSGYRCAVIEGGNPCPAAGAALVHLGPDMLMAVCVHHERRIDLHQAHIEWERRHQP